MDLDILNDAENINSKIRNGAYDRYSGDFIYDLIAVMEKIAEKYSNTAQAEVLNHYTRDYNEAVMTHLETMLNGRKINDEDIEKAIVKYIEKHIEKRYRGDKFSCC